MIEYTYARDGKTCLCCFHPKEVVVGVCALCLNERLLVLASKQEKINKFMKNTTNEYYRSFLMSKKKNINDGHDHHHHQGGLEHNNNNHQYPRIHLPKMFALSSLLSRLDISHGRKVEEVHDIADDDASSCSHEESFISIKFENNGVGSWEKKGVTTSAVPKVSLNNKHCDMSWSRTTSSKDGNGGAKVAVIEHVKPRLPLRWRKRIGHIFQVIKLKRSTKGSSSSVCHVGTKLEGVKVRHGHGHGWIRTLTKRKTKD